MYQYLCIKMEKKSITLDNNIVVCHLPRGSKLRWREDMGGGLPKIIKKQW